MGGVEDGLALSQDRRGVTDVHHRRSEQARARVTVLVVVPGAEDVAEGAGALDGAKAIRELRTILHGAEVAFRIGVVVGDIGAAVGLGHPQVGQRKGHRFGPHDPAAIRMQRELTGWDVVLANGLLEELLGQLGALTMSDHPAGDIAAEDVQDHIEVEVGPLEGTQQLGDVPAPKLIGGGGQQFRLLVGG